MIKYVYDEKPFSAAYTILESPNTVYKKQATSKIKYICSVSTVNNEVVVCTYSQNLQR